MPVPVRQALKRIQAQESDILDHWSFVETIKSNGNTEVARYDPRQAAGEKWHLVRVNGKPATAKQSKSFKPHVYGPHAVSKQEKKKGAGNVAREQSGFHFTNFLRHARYTRLQNQNGHMMTFAFTPLPRAHTKNAGVLKHLVGRLVLTKIKPVPVKLSMSNQEAFSPKFGVKIANFRFTMRFRKLPHADITAVDALTSKVSGKIFWFKHFKTVTEVTLTKWACVKDCSSAKKDSTQK